MNKDQMKGRIEQVKGKARNVAGRVTGNKELEIKGRLQSAGGKVQAGFGDARKRIKHSV